MKKLICIIITLIMTLSLFPVNAAADDTVYRISIDNKGNLSITPEPSNPDSVYSWSGGESTGELVLLSGYKFNLDINQRIQGITNNGTITDAHFTGPAAILNSGTISGGDFAKVSRIDNEGTISGGSFGISSAILIESLGNITNGKFGYIAEIKNSGTVSGGTFEGKFTNNAYGTIEGSPVFNRTTEKHSTIIEVVNNGTISGGTFYYIVSNYGNVSGGTYECSFTNCETGTINDSSVEVKGDRYSFDNRGTVNGGTFSTGMTFNSGTIGGGTFTGELWNISGGVISSGARFSGKVLNQTGATISQGYFSNIVENCGKIVNGNFGGDSTKIFTAPVINEGEITGGSFRDVVYSINGGTIDESFLKNGLFTLTLKDCRISGINADAISFQTGFPLDMDKSITVTAVEKSGMNLTGWSIDGGTINGLNYTFDLPYDNATISPIYTSTHTHSYSEEWKSDENGHWHECSCGDKSGYEKHTHEAFAAKEPTCTEDGCTSGEKCSVCGYIISASEIIPAKGHGETEVRNAVPAEIGKNGYTGDTYCKVCGEKIAEGKVIPALGRETGAVADTSNHAPNVPAAPAKDKWDDASDRIAKASDGETVTVSAKDRNANIPKSIIEKIKGRDIDLVIDFGNGISWKINGTSVDTAKSVDMGIKKGTKNIPASVLNTVTGENSTVQLSLTYDGEFGFFAELSVDLGRENDGLFAALYHFNETSGEMELVDQSEIKSGKASFTMSHASEYAIVISGAPVYDNVDSASGAEDMSETAERGSAAVIIVIAAASAALFIAKKKSFR